MKNTAHFAVTVIGKDRPGIVAGAAEILFRLGCNIEDSSCSILGGEFAMILIVSHEKPFSKARLQEEFKSFAEDVNLSVFIRALSDTEARHTEAAGELCVVTVYGADRPGIVYRVAQALAERSISINDLNTKLVGGEENPVYVLTLEAALPESVTADDVAALLEKLKEELKVEISVRLVTPISL